MTAFIQTHFPFVITNSSIIFLFFSIIILILCGSFLTLKGNVNINIGSLFCVLSTLCFIFTIIIHISNSLIVHEIDTFNTLIECDFEQSSCFVFIFCIFSTIFFMFLNYSYETNILKTSFEFPVIILITLFCGLFMFYTDNMLLWLLMIEIQSICCYALVTYRDRTPFLRTIASTIYFITGCIASLSILLGIAGFYVEYGTVDLNIILVNLSLDEFNNYTYIYIYLIYAGLSIKIGLPYSHKWLPDVYTSSNRIVVFFLVIIPKIPLLYLTNIVGSVDDSSGSEVLALVLGLLFASTMCFSLTKLYDFFGFTAIVSGTYLQCFITESEHLEDSTLALYIVAYYFSVTAILGTLCFIQRTDATNTLIEISDLASIVKANKTMTFIFFYNLYNIAGLPPLLLFGSKFILLSYLHETGDNFVLFSFLLFSILSMFYYLRVLKVIFFDVGYSSGGITLNNKFAFLIAGLSVASFACNLYLFFEILS